MSHLLGIPREIRDEIYELTLNEPLQSFKDRSLQRDRKCGSSTTFPTQPESLHGEKQVCYPLRTSLPPAHGLLLAGRQLRAELLETVKRMRLMRYKVDISSREDNGLIAPTWIAVPLFTDRIDVLEAQWRFRAKKTSSIATFDGDDITAWGSGFNATLAMLQRFVERGVYLLSKKKRRSIHIGLLDINMDTPTDMPREQIEIMIDEIVRSVDEWMIGEEYFGWDDNRKEREDGQFDLLSGKIDRLRFRVNGVLKHEWVVADEVEKREQRRNNYIVELAKSPGP
jgi:hypothetical protein